MQPVSFSILANKVKLQAKRMGYVLIDCKCTNICVFLSYLHITQRVTLPFHATVVTILLALHPVRELTAVTGF